MNQPGSTDAPLRPRRHLSLNARVLLMTLVPTGLMALALGGYFSWQQMREAEQQLLQRGLMTVEYLQRPAADALLDGDVARFGLLLEAALNHTDVRSLSLHDVDMRPLQHRGPQMYPAGEPLTGLTITAGTGLQIQRSKHSSRFIMPLLARPELTNRQAHPEVAADSLLGWLEVELAHGNLLLERYQNLLATLITIILGLALTGLVVSIMGRRITEPVGRINAAIRQISQGHFDIRLGEQGSRELDDLAQGVSTMALTMQSAQGELQQNIDQATEDLRQTLETIEIQNIELDLARKTAQEASRIKSEFLANMSHELRTPLNGILGFSTLLQRTELSGRQQEYLSTIEKSADNLLAIINEILDFSKIEAGKLILENLSFNLRDLIDDTLTMLAPSAHDKGLELVSIIYRDTPLGLSGDPMRLKQILANLISNAIKFTHEGSVSVRVMAEHQDANQVLLRISVNDTGIGLSPTQQKSLFKAFSQADNSISRQTGGTGLGLVISKRLVEQMHGEIGLRSQPGEGSEFWLTLRLARSAHSEDELPEKPLLGMRAALVEPQLLSRQMLLHNLEDLGLSVRVFDNTQELHEALTSRTNRDDSLQLALISVRHTATAPGDTLEMARQWSELNICKTIVLTDTTEHYPLLDQLPRSMCQTVSKPVCTRKLHRAVMHLLGNDPLAAPSPARQGVHNLRVLCVDDNLANLKLLEAFLADMAVDSLLATSGEEALELLTEQMVDLIFMDVQMPGMDGRQTTAELRLREEIAGFDPVPIVALTAHALTTERRELLQCGMNDYLTKPITTEQLRHSLNKWTGMAPAQPAAPAPPAAPAQDSSTVGAPSMEPVPTDSLAAIDLEEGLRLAAGKADLAEDLLQMLLAGLPDDRQAISSALEQGERKALLERVHKLHGASRYCGAPELRARCQQAETLLKQDRDSHGAVLALLTAIDRLLDASVS
ncbi:multi-sensor hybrid histidine kinase [Pseudomonas saudimassiliensis]|uniref:histidine kinase n=2 Tax=Pseudomonas saudimassiliensis TaxID=1461581 RepID=A0A078M172_9PSED|nr:multi-sensor hybrid histidine kinase [Pseudomonas saudimassiliensis]CEF25395.1 multi-sensor hybrid histidine kinase [Pseudomonas saudimassiliensis]